MKNKITIIFLFFSLSTLFSQNGIQLNTPEADNGYALLTFFGEAVLLDNCGDIVHEWNLENAFVTYHCKLLPNGNIIYIESGFIIERDWQSDVVNSTFVSGVACDYEIEILPSGNYLVVGRRNISQSEAISLGFDTSVQQPSKVDVVVEVNPNTSSIVWEWDIRDHLIQDFNSIANNYGVVADNPRKLDIGALGTYDWTFEESFMINGMDYNPDLDQIMLSVRKMSEFIIIDHSTTTEESASSTGGDYGHGGDILYRWGNPQNYGQGTEDDRILYYQHNPNWILEGEHAGKISVFNNGLNRPVPTLDDRYSSVEIVNSPINADGSYNFTVGNAFEPLIPELSYNELTIPGLEFYSSYLSAAKVLENGNIFITVGIDNYDIEINSAGEVVWRYNYENSNGFRTEKYPVNYPAFEGKNLTPTGTVENPPSDYLCEIISSVNSAPIDLVETIDFVYDFDTQLIKIDNHSLYALQTEVYSLQGEILQYENTPVGNSSFSLKNTTAGFYFVKITDPKTHSSSTFKIVLL
ncbi:MAG: hypothetical protein ACI85O_002176 [Saprospiraceae bacterium]|jgi:hypothetical protein